LLRRNKATPARVLWPFIWSVPQPIFFLYIPSSVSARLLCHVLRWCQALRLSREPLFKLVVCQTVFACYSWAVFLGSRGLVSADS
jgi:hypothetical protein